MGCMSRAACPSGEHTALSRALSLSLSLACAWRSCVLDWRRKPLTLALAHPPTHPPAHRSAEFTELACALTPAQSGIYDAAAQLWQELRAGLVVAQVCCLCVCVCVCVQAVGGRGGSSASVPQRDAPPQCLTPCPPCPPRPPTHPHYTPTPTAGRHWLHQRPLEVVLGCPTALLQAAVRGSQGTCSGGRGARGAGGGRLWCAHGLVGGGVVVCAGGWGVCWVQAAVDPPTHAHAPTAVVIRLQSPSPTHPPPPPPHTHTHAHAHAPTAVVIGLQSTGEAAADALHLQPGEACGWVRCAAAAAAAAAASAFFLWLWLCCLSNSSPHACLPPLPPAPPPHTHGRARAFSTCHELLRQFIISHFPTTRALEEQQQQEAGGEGGGGGGGGWDGAWGGAEEGGGTPSPRGGAGTQQQQQQGEGGGEEPTSVQLKAALLARAEALELPPNSLDQVLSNCSLACLLALLCSSSSAAHASLPSPRPLSPRPPSPPHPRPPLPTPHPPILTHATPTPHPSPCSWWMSWGDPLQWLR